MTDFKMKTCVKCGNNHEEEEGTLCGFCRAKVKRDMDRQKPAPKHYFLECLIEREGDTHTSVGKINYVFKRNENGHSVCEIINSGHYDILVKSRLYRPYDFRETDEDPGPAPGQTLSEIFTREEQIIAAIHKIPRDKYAAPAGGRPSQPKRSDVFDLTGFTVTAAEITAAMMLMPDPKAE